MQHRSMICSVGGILSALIVAMTTSSFAGSPLAAPMDGNLVLTSSFGEYRSGHYHGGLDYSTGGKEGRPVLAPGKGWVYRLRASGIGYGRAIYFRLEDGRTVLLAHLSQYHPRIAAEVTRTQDRLGRYEIDYNPAPGTLSFVAGDILGYSGQSGAGPPHLHAEIRIGEDAALAVNPITEGWTVEDTIAPTVTRLRIEPGGPGVRVQGRVSPVIVPLNAGETTDTVTVTGPVRLWVEANDYASSRNYRVAPHIVGARVDGEAVFEVRFDRFHWNWAREVEWTFQNALARSRKERWVSMETPPGARQTIARSRTSSTNWTESLSSGVHRVTLYAQDLAGNTTEVTVPLKVTPGATPEALSGPAIERDDVVSRGGYLEFRVAGQKPVSVYATAPDGSRMESFAHVLPAPGGWIYQCDEPDPPLAGLWGFAYQTPAGDSLVGYAVWTGPSTSGEPLSWAGYGATGAALRMELSPKATYGPMWITIDPDPTLPERPENRPDLEPVMGVVSLGPWAAPLREGVAVALDPPRNTGSRAGLALYSWGTGGWGYDGADTSSAGVGGRLKRLERLTLFRDRTPPTITVDPLVDTGVLAATIEDGGVGVIWPDVAMVLDGTPVIAEWDPESKRLTGFPRAALVSGEHVIKITASDRVGNRAQKVKSFVIP